ncbi:MAG: V-type ATPase subunit, partial [Clostridia bacterium]|nr:V-type ATPase subunit [Clostridia bacterium]
QLLIAELDEALKTLKELCANKWATKYFIAKYDYLNAKALMKCKYMRTDGLAYCYNEATIPADKMQKAFVADDYSLCSKNMAEACDGIDTQYADGNRSPSVIDLLLDKAMYADMKTYAKKCKFKYKFVQQMFVYLVDTTNLMTAFRMKKANLDATKYADMIIDGGSIGKETLLALFDDESKQVNLSYDYKRFFQLTNGENVNLAEAENEQKAHIFAILKDNANLLTIQPVLEYFFNKVNEIERIRKVLSAVKSGQDKDKIKELLK